MATADRSSRDFLVGDVLAKTWALIRQRPAALTFAALCGWLPLFVISEALDAMYSAGRTMAAGDVDSHPGAELADLGSSLLQYMPSDHGTGQVVIGAALFLVAFVFPVIGAAMTTHLVLPGPLNSRTRVRDAFIRTASRLPHLVAVMLIASVAAIGGLVLLIAPGLLALTAWAVAVQACASEKLGPLRSLKRSADLTKGFRWRNLGLVLLIVAASITTSEARAFAASQFGLAGFAAGAVADLAVTMAGNVGLAVAYWELRIVKEGLDAAGVADVFD